MSIENEILEYALMDGINHIHKKLESGEFSKLTSGFVRYKDIRECVNVKDDDFRQSEKKLVENMTKQLYSLLFTNPMVFAFAMSKVKLKSAPVTVKDYTNLVLETLKQMKLFNQDIQKEFRNGTPQHLYLIFSAPEQRKVLDDMVKVVDAFVPYFENAVKAERVCSDKYLRAGEFARLIGMFNAKMEESLVSANSLIQNWDNSGSVNDIAYDVLVDGFKEKSKEILSSATKAIDSNEKQQLVPKISEPVVSEEEGIRLQTIAQANYLYDELVNDTMRDLQEQVPYSAREMYAYFVDVKFANFVKEHKMPLAKSTSLKQAQDVVSKLNGLYNYVSKISENSRVSIVYGNEMMQ